MGFRKYLREKIERWEKKDDSRLVELAKGLHLQSVGNVLELVPADANMPEDAKFTLTKALITGTSPEFYVRVARAQMNLAHPYKEEFIDLLRIGSHYLKKVL